MTTPATTVDRTGSTTTRVLGALIVVGTAALAWLGLVASKPDTELGETVRLLYVHVPMPTVAYLACFLCALGSAMYLWKRSLWWDLVAASSAEIAVVFASLTIVTGALWGKATWGAYWVWEDARLTTTLMLVLLIAGYLALRRTSSDPEVASRRSAIVGLLLVPNVIVVNRSVEWWDTLHQKSTLVRPDPQIEGLQLFTLFLGIVLGLVVFAWLLILRFRLAWLEHEAAEVGLDEALIARRAEAAASGAPLDQPRVDAGGAR